ncbi:MAG: hypothetical protein FPO08_04070 [Geobacter sp.]|nr:MAG: hypothetical protein FPO08_04070 [Geobacter sp.]
MRIRTYNVGFGDFFIITKGSDSLVCDCGSVSKPAIEMEKIVSGAKKSILDSSLVKKALITHFHSDHISGFKQLSKKHSKYFDEVYIPYLTTTDRKTGRKVLLEAAFFMYLVLDKKTLSHVLAKNIIKSIELCLSLSSSNKVRLLSEGDSFNIGSRKFKVLWPRKVIDFPSVLVSKLEEVEKAFRGSEFLALKDNFISLFAELTSDLSGNATRAHMETIYDKMTKVLEKASDTEILTRKLINDVRSILSKGRNTYTLFSRSNNSTSIVFESIGCIDSVLMTGDIEKDTTDLIKFSLPKYWVVKAPHHGTENHYSLNLPLGHNILISSEKHKKYGKISTAYQKYTQKVCTCDNKNCDCAVPCMLGTCLTNPSFGHCDLSLEFGIKNKLKLDARELIGVDMGSGLYS